MIVVIPMMKKKAVNTFNSGWQFKLWRLLQSPLMKNMPMVSRFDFANAYAGEAAERIETSLLRPVKSAGCLRKYHPMGRAVTNVMKRNKMIAHGEQE